MGDGVHQPEIAADGPLDAGPQHLDHDLGPVLQASGVDLRDGGGGERDGVERVEDVVDRAAPGLLDDGARLGPVEGRHLILELGQLDGQVVRQQIAPGREDLAELDEDGPQLFQREAHAHRIGGRQVAPKPVPGRDVHDPP